MRNIEFRHLDQRTAEWARCLHNDPDVLKMLTDPQIVTPEEQLVWLSKINNSSSSARWVVSCDGNDIGVVRIDQLDRHNKSVCVGLDIHKDFRGKGYAKSIYRELFNYYFYSHDFNRIWLSVAAYNDVALGLYRALGFVEEGVQRQALYKDGAYHDYITMSILKEENKNG